MAERKIARSMRIKEYIFGEECFWTTSKNVGYGYQNTQKDVMLVQYFLNCTPYRYNLVVDGKFGGKTWNAIKDFQDACRVKADGMISPVSGERLHGSKSGTIYTLLSLNQEYWRKYPQFFNDIARDPFCPTPLRQQFTVPDWVFDNGVC